MASLSQIASSLILLAGDVLIGRVKITDGTDVMLVDASGNANVILAANSGVDIGDVNVTASAAGGCKMFNDIDLDESDIDVATGPCTVYGIYGWNSTAGPLFLKLFNTNAVTMGSTAAVASLPISANADSDGAGFTFPIPSQGLAFGTALTVAVTTGAALDDNTAPGDGAANVTILYQD